MDEKQMMNFIIGVVIGIVVASIGFGGMAQVLDSGVAQVKQQAQKLAK